MVEAADVSTSGRLDAHLPIYDFLGLKIEHQSAQLVVARFTVSMSSMQPYRALHGGISAFIAESLAGIGAGEASRWRPLVGLEVTMNHLRGAPIGTAIIATAVPLRVGGLVQVWEVRLEEDKEREEEWKSTWAKGADAVRQRKGKLFAMGTTTVIVPKNAVELVGPTAGVKISAKL